MFFLKPSSSAVFLSDALLLLVVSLCFPQPLTREISTSSHIIRFILFLSEMAQMNFPGNKIKAHLHLSGNKHSV